MHKIHHYKLCYQLVKLGILLSRELLIFVILNPNVLRVITINSDFHEFELSLSIFFYICKGISSKKMKFKSAR